KYPHSGYNTVATASAPELTSPHLKSSNPKVSLICTCNEPIINLSVWCSSMKKKKITTTNQR
ncbi:MAG: hypothetical protein L0287_38020, partial [Anaerolineae bacterium]|nr:hypothetical protein [Anaerolineae bacterium]